MVGWSRQMLYSGFNILPRSVIRSADFNGRSDNLDVIPLPKRLMNRFQVTIRALLLVTLLSAVAVVAWTNRPEGVVVLKITEDGSIQVDGVPVESENLHEKLVAKLRWHHIWLMNCELNVASDETTPEALVKQIVDDSSLPIFDSFTWSQSYTVTVPYPEE